MEVDFANDIKIYGVVKKDQFQRKKWLILAIYILVKLNPRIRIIDGIYERKAVKKRTLGSGQPTQCLMTVKEVTE